MLFFFYYYYSSLCCQKIRYFWFKWTNRPFPLALICPAHAGGKEPNNKNKPNGRQKRGRLQWSEDKNDGTTTAENGPCGARIRTQRAAVRGTSLTKAWLKTPSRVPLSVQMKKQTKKQTKKKKTKIKRSRLPVGKVLAAASQEANSRHLTSFEWCDYVWSGPWQVAAAPLCGCVRATNPRQQD